MWVCGCVSVDLKKQCFFFIVFFNLEMIKKIKNKRTKKNFKK